MADRTAELTVLLRAKDLGTKAAQTFAGGLDNVAKAASGVRDKMEGLGRGAAVGLGMAAETLLTGGGVVQAATQLGVHMASELVETFGEQAIARFTSSSLIGLITAPLAAVGSAAGGIIAAAIPVGMALLPVIIIGAIVAAIAVLIVNEEIRNKVFGFIGGVLKWMGDALGKLGQVFLDALGAAWRFISQDVPKLGGKIVGGIIDGLKSLPGKLGDAIWSAIRSVLPINIGPIHITEKGITLDPIGVPNPTASQSANYHLTGQVPGHNAAGGWSGLHGPELKWMGEREPELTIPKSQLGQLGGSAPQTIILQIDGREVARAVVPAVSRQLYWQLQTAPPTAGRT